MAGGKRNRSVKVKESSQNKPGCEEKPLKKDDIICPICYTIFLDPVTFPCHHSVCRPCFDVHIWETSLNCPCCRLRLSIWCRRVNKENDAVNVRLKERIEKEFPDEVAAQRIKNEGLEGSPELEEAEKILTSFFSDYSVPSALDGQLSCPGEIVQDFEVIFSKHREDLEKERLAAEEASQAFINDTVTEEDLMAMNQLEKDFQLAEELQRAEEAASVSLRSRTVNISPPLSQAPSALNSSIQPKTLSNSGGSGSGGGNKRRTSVRLQSSTKRSCQRKPKVVTPPSRAVQTKIGKYFTQSPSTPKVPLLNRPCSNLPDGSGGGFSPLNESTSAVPSQPTSNIFLPSTVNESTPQCLKNSQFATSTSTRRDLSDWDEFDLADFKVKEEPVDSQDPHSSAFEQWLSHDSNQRDVKPTTDKLTDLKPEISPGIKAGECELKPVVSEMDLKPQFLPRTNLNEYKREPNVEEINISGISSVHIKVERDELNPEISTSNRPAADSQKSLDFGTDYFNKLKEEDELVQQLWSRLQQEEEDRKLALRLQQLYDQGHVARGRHGTSSEKFSLRSWATASPSRSNRARKS